MSRSESQDDGIYALCGRVNAKNGYGGYTGFTPFFITTDSLTMIASSEPAGSISYAWPVWCGNAITGEIRPPTKK